MAADESPLAPAQALIAERRFDEALRALAKIAERGPLTAEGHCLVARCHIGLNNGVDAMQSARSAVTAEPTSGPAHRVVSAAALLLGDKTTARAAAEEAVRLAPNVMESHIALFRVADAERDMEAAAKAASEARALAPERPGGHVAMGLVAVRQRRPRNAEQHFRDALACAPHDAAALDGLRTLMQDRKRATNVLRFASRQESGHPQAHEIASRFAGAPTALLAIVFVATIILVPRAGGSVGEAAAAGFAVLLLFVLVVLRLRYLPTGRLGGDAGRRRVRLLWFLGSIGVVVSVLFAAYFAAIGLSDLIGADDHAAEDVLLLAYAAALMWLAIWFVSRMRRIADA